jgi:hypothetical protein
MPESEQTEMQEQEPVPESLAELPESPVVQGSDSSPHELEAQDELLEAVQANQPELEALNERLAERGVAVVQETAVITVTEATSRHSMTPRFDRAVRPWRGK